MTKSEAKEKIFALLYEFKFFPPEHLGPGIRTMFESELSNTIDAISEAPEPKWISVKERMPEIDEDVLVFGREDWTKRAIFNVSMAALTENGTWMPDCSYVSGYEWEVDKLVVTHWMPLPEPPRDELERVEE